MKLYIWDTAGLFIGAVEMDDFDPMPPRSTPTPPPQLSGAQAARWTGSGWEKLAKAPEPELPTEQAADPALYERAVQATLDDAARARGYDSLATAISYAEEPAVPRFQADGQAFRRWRSLVWDYAHSVLNAVLAGEQVQPELGEFIASLPALELPA